MSDTATAPTEATPAGGFLAAALSALQETNPNASLQEVMRAPEAEQVTIEQKSPTPKVETAPPAQEKHQIQFSSNPLDDFNEEKKEEPINQEFDSSEIDSKYPENPENLQNDPKGLARWGEMKSDLRSEKGRSHQLTRSLAQKENELKVLQAQLEELKASGGNGNEWKEKYESIKQKDARLALEEDAEFQSKVLAPFQAAGNNIDQFVADFGLSATEIQRALNAKTRAERNGILNSILSNSEMDDLSKQDFITSLRDYENMSAKVNEARAKAVELYEGTQAKRQQQAHQQQQERLNKLQEVESSVFDKVSKHPVFKEVFNGSSGELREMVKKNLTAETPPDIAVFEKLTSFAYKPLTDAIAAKTARIKELEEIVARHVSGGGAIGAKPSPQTEDQEPEKLPRGVALGNALRQANGGRDYFGSQG